MLGDATDPDYRSAFPKGTTAHASQDGDTVIVTKNRSSGVAG